jgi:hypothetical protein
MAHCFLVIFSLVLDALIYGVIPCDMSLLSFQCRWLCLGGQRPGNAYLYILVAWEWTVACFSVGTAWAAINVNLFALQHHYCDEGGRPACVLYLVASAMAFAAGSLAAVSALGIVWIHGSRFRPVQAP